jgi:hypothetical protein
MNTLKLFFSALVLVFTVYCGGAQAINTNIDSYFQNCVSKSGGTTVVCSSSQTLRNAACKLRANGSVSGGPTKCGTGANCSGCG